MEVSKLSSTIKQLRKEYHLTQEELAFKSGVGLRFQRNGTGQTHIKNGQSEPGSRTF